MYMLKRAIAQKRSEKYLAKQKHLAALKWKKEHPVERKKVTLTPEEIEKKKARLLRIRRKIWHRKAYEHARACKHAMHRFNEAKKVARKLNKKLQQKGLTRRVRSILRHKAARANRKVAKVPAILAQKPAPKKAKVEKKPAAAKTEKKPAAQKKATKAQTKK
jgi:hypothetical protein